MQDILPYLTNHDLDTIRSARMVAELRSTSAIREFTGVRNGDWARGVVFRQARWLLRDLTCAIQRLGDDDTEHIAEQADDALQNLRRDDDPPEDELAVAYAQAIALGRAQWLLGELASVLERFGEHASVVGGRM